MAFSGPFRETRSIVSIPQTSVTRDRYRQRAPYIERLPYNFRKEWQELIPNTWGFAPSSLPGAGTSLNFPDVQALAYGKFKQAAINTVNLAVNIAERKQAVDLIAKRCMQIYRFAKYLRVGDVQRAADVLSLRQILKKKRRKYTLRTYRDGEVRFRKGVKFFGDNFLEYHFGWEPLVKDIGAAIELLHDSPFKGLSTRVKVTASSAYKRPRTPNPSKWSGDTVGWYPRVSYQMIANVLVDDPNILRLNQMGFINPFVIAWELVPFSFVVDWFANVGDILSSYTDFAGMSLNNASTTIFAQYKDETWWNGGNIYYGAAPFVSKPVYNRHGVYVVRSQGIRYPMPGLKAVKWPSVTRGLTAASLLSQFLRP